MRLGKRAAYGALLALVSTILTTTVAHEQDQLVLDASASLLPEHSSSASLVPVKIGLMSRCPDFISFAAHFSRALPQVWSMIDLQYAYIATRNQSAPYGASCKHGDIECAGNVHELCVNDHLRSDKNVSPVEAQRTAWDFIECLNFGGVEDIGDEDAARRCLSVVHGPRWEEDGIKRCAQGKQGANLLAKSSKDARKSDIVKSATLQIDGNTVCIRDGGEWKDCAGGHEPSDWVRAIQAAYRERNPFTPLPAVPVYHAEDVVGHNAKLVPPTQVLRKRQSSGSPPPPPPPSNSQNPFNNDGQRTTPLSVFTFVIAIALFVLVVAFVLLRIFVRNRRLRRLGLLPEGGPMERYFGGALGGVPEDTLVPPKLWEASIVDVRKASTGQGASTLSLGAKGSKTHGWDALMPISAALPTSICASLNNGEKPGGPQKPNGPVTQDATAQAATTSQGLGKRLGLFRRTTAEGPSTSGTAEASRDAAVVSDEKALDERVPANVNVTVLIAMPSPHTVFPGRAQRSSAAATLRSPASQATFKTANLATTHPVDEIEEDERQAEEKGKTRALHRAPSISSVATRKSVRETRREAFFGEMPADAAEQAEAEVDLVRGGGGDGKDGAETHYEDEDEELPELVFGTTSVPIYSRISHSSPPAAGAPLSLGHQYLQTPASELDHPHRKELLELIQRARAAQESKERAEVAKRAAEAAKQAEETNAANRASAAPTREDARASLANTSIDATAPGQPEGDSSDGRARLEDAVAGTLQPRPSTASTDAFPAGTRYGQSARPSLALAEAGTRRDSSRTVDPLLSRPPSSVPEGAQEEGHHNLYVESSTSLTAHPLSADSPIPATPGTETLPRTSTSTWHTGVTGPRSEATPYVVGDDEDDQGEQESSNGAQARIEASRRLESSRPA